MSEFPNRAALRGPRHAVAADHPLAARAGARVLDAGGSAADAAIAAAATMIVVQPRSSHLGGDLFALTYDVREGSVSALNASGPAPLSADVASIRTAGTVPNAGAGSVTIPGCVGGWWALHQAHGVLPWAALFEEAINYARGGFPASRAMAGVVAAGRRTTLSPAYFERTFGGVRAGGGQRVMQPETAETLGAIAAHGEAGFYEGGVADSCRSVLEGGGSPISAEEWRSPARWEEPLTVDFAGYRVHTQPPPSLGIRLALALKEYAALLASSDQEAAASPWPLQVQAMRSAFGEAAALAGDPETSGFDAGALLNRPAVPVEAGADTTYLLAIDAAGNAVSLIQSVFNVWGSQLWDDATGVLFNNRMAGFSLMPGHPNEIAPGKRPMHTLNCYLVTRRAPDA